MAHEEPGGESGKEHHTSRRALLKAAGVTTVALASSGVVGAAGSDTVTGASTVVDLGNEGLTDGDLIDPYLETHFRDDVEVHIPAGEYQYTGAGLGGAYTNAAIIGSSDGVVFNRPSDAEQEIRPAITASGGTVHIENITVRGQRGQTQSLWEVGASADASMHLLNINFPDGAVAESESMGIYARPDHAGVLWVKGCHFAQFANVALHVSDPAENGDGQVAVEDCTFVNTGTSAVRFAPESSLLRGCYFEATEAAPTPTEGSQQRGIELPASSQALRIADCDFNWSGPGTSAIAFTASGEGSAGELRDLRLQYGDQDPLFNTAWDIESGWSGENINVSEA